MWTSIKQLFSKKQQRSNSEHDILDTNAPREKTLLTITLDDFLSSEQTSLTYLGFQVSKVLSSSKSWMYRKVECITPLDGRTVLKEVSVDFDVTNQLYIVGMNYNIIPLAVLRKKTFTSFSLRDEEETSIPMLLSQENGILASSFLLYLAKEAISSNYEDPLPEEIVKNIYAMATLSRGEAELHYNKLKNSLSPPSVPQYEYLKNDELFMYWAKTLSENFILFACSSVGTAPAVIRKVLKYSHTEELENCLPETHRPTDNIFTFVLRKLGFLQLHTNFNLEMAQFSESYHLEIKLPESMHFTEGSLSYETEDKLNDPFISKEFKKELLALGEKLEKKNSMKATLSGGTAHVNLKGINKDATLYFKAKLKGSPSWSFPSILASGISGLMIFLASDLIKRKAHAIEAANDVKLAALNGEGLALMAVLAAVLSFTLPLILNQIRTNSYMERRYQGHALISKLSAYLPALILLQLITNFQQQFVVTVAAILIWFIFFLLLASTVIQILVIPLCNYTTRIKPDQYV